MYECSASETQCVRDAVHQEAAWEAWAVYESAAHQNAVHQEAVYEKKTGAVLLLDRVRNLSNRETHRKVRAEGSTRTRNGEAVRTETGRGQQRENRAAETVTAKLYCLWMQ